MDLKWEKETEEAFLRAIWKKEERRGNTWNMEWTLVRVFTSSRVWYVLKQIDDGFFATRKEEEKSKGMRWGDKTMWEFLLSEKKEKEWVCGGFFYLRWRKKEGRVSEGLILESCTEGFFFYKLESKINNFGDKFSGTMSLH